MPRAASASASTGVGWSSAPDGAIGGAVAQLGERLTGSQKAGGSSPPSSTTSLPLPIHHCLTKLTLRSVGIFRFSENFFLGA